MRVTVFDDESMEPITAITLPRWAVDRLRSGEIISVPYTHKITLAGATSPASLPVAAPVNYWCELWFEPFIRRNRERHWLCFTRDGEHALNLKSVFLSGQARAVIEREKAAFNEGVVASLARMYGR